MIIDFKSILNTLVLICDWQWEVSPFYAVSSKSWSVIWNPLSTLLLDFLFVDLQDLCVCVLSCQVVFNSLWFSELYHQALRSMVFSKEKILEWVAISFSRGSSWPRDWTLISCVSSILRLYHWATWEDL